MSTKYIASNWRLPNQAGVDSYLNDNYGLTFSVNEYIDAGNSLDIVTSNHSFSIWLKTTTVSNQVVTEKGTNAELALQFGGGADAGKIFWLSPSTKIDETINDGTWHNIICVADGSVSRMYLDGVLKTIGGNKIKGTANSSNLNIGSRAGSFAFSGSISELTFFDYALSDGGVSLGETAGGQISTLYGSSSLGAGNPMALKPAPVAFYPLGDNSSGNPLTQPNEAVEDASVFDFDAASNNYIDCGTSSSFGINDKLTISAWIFVTTGGLYQGIVGGTITNYLFYTDNSAIPKLRFWDGSGVSSTGTVSLNTWHHVAVTVDSGVTNGLTFYIDGVPSGTGTKTIITNNDNLTIGSTLNGNFLNGKLSNVQIWSAELSSSEIETLYNSGVPLTGTQPQASNLKAWYKLDQSANWEADSSGAWQIPDAVSAYPQSFNFVDDKIEIQNIGNLFSGITNFSFSGWFNLTSFGSQQVFNILEGNNSRFGINTFNNQLRFNIYPGVAYIANLQNITSVNQWFHYAGVFNGAGASDTDRLKLYINGQPQTVIYYTTTPNSFPTLLSTADISIGGALSPFNGMTGKSSNIQLWNTTLSEPEIETIYNNGVPLTTAIATDNLKAWYKLDNTATFSTNWSIPDASGNGNTGTSSGMTEQNLVNNNVSALNGESSGMTSANLVLTDLTRNLPYDSYSFNFDAASSDYINCGTSSDLEITGDLTLSAWVYLETGGAYQGIISKRDSANPNYQLYTDNSATPKLRFYAGTAGGSPTSSTGTVSLNAWHHIAITVESGVTNGSVFYIDGVNSGTATFTINEDDADLLLGSLSSSSGFLSGKLSNVSIFNEALTSTEVLKLYANGMPQDLSSFTPAPVAWWTLGSNSFFNGSNFICKDLIGSNDGTSVNAGVDALVGNTPRSEANGTGTNMDIPTNLEGQTKYSSNNSWSINMSESARVADTP